MAFPEQNRFLFFILQNTSMKKTILFLISCVVISFSMAQNSSCCTKPAEATEAFALFSGDKKFKNTHEEPLPFTLEKTSGKMIQFATDDGKAGSAYEVKPAVASRKYIIVFHEWWGLNDYIRQEAEKLSLALGVNVYAVDLYDGKVASNRDSAAAYMGGLSSERAFSIIHGLMGYFGEDATIGTIGWCMGGGWSLQASIAAGSQSKACVIYYGMPEKDPAKLATLAAPVLGIFGSQDQWINPTVVEEFKAVMTSSKKALQVEMYEADHAFANPSNPKHDAVKTQDAFEKTVAFFQKNL